jgi:hypothetical protein
MPGIGKVYHGAWKAAKKKHESHLGNVKFNLDLGPNVEKLDKMDYSKPSNMKDIKALSVKIINAVKTYTQEINSKVTDKTAIKELCAALDKIKEAV